MLITWSEKRTPSKPQKIIVQIRIVNTSICLKLQICGQRNRNLSRLSLTPIEIIFSRQSNKKSGVRQWKIWYRELENLGKASERMRQFLSWLSTKLTGITLRASSVTGCSLTVRRGKCPHWRLVLKMIMKWWSVAVRKPSMVEGDVK